MSRSPLRLAAPVLLGSVCMAGALAGSAQPLATQTLAPSSTLDARDKAPSTFGSRTAQVLGWVSARRVTRGQAPTGPQQGPLFRDRSRLDLPSQHTQLGEAHPTPADIDGDGDLDLLIAKVSGGLEIWVNAGDGSFTDETNSRIAAPLHPLAQVEAADLDQDGDIDFVAPSADTVSNFPDRVWINTGGGQFIPGMALPDTGQLTAGLAIGDINSDGKLDLVLAKGRDGHGSQGGRDQLLYGNGSGQFVAIASFAAATWNEQVTASASVSLADIDGDSDLDIFVAKIDSTAASGSQGGFNRLLRNNGTAGFSDVSASQLLPNWRKDNSSKATFADLDGDGDMDIVVSNSVLSVPGPLSADVLWNQGGAQGGTEGVFVDGTNALPEFPSLAESIRLDQVVADFNLDGRMDILFLVHDLPPGGDQPMYLGQPGGIFVRASWFRTGTFISRSGTSFDADGDGDHDIMFSVLGSAAGGTDVTRTRFYRNYAR